MHDVWRDSEVRGSTLSFDAEVARFEFRITPPSTLPITRGEDGLIFEGGGRVEAQPGDPRIPLVAVTVVVPANTTAVAIEDTRLEWVDAGLDDLPAPVPAPQLRAEDPAGAPRGPSYESTQPYPDDSRLLICDPTPHTRFPFGRLRLVAIRLAVFRMYGADRRLERCERATARLTCTLDPATAPHYDEAMVRRIGGRLKPRERDVLAMMNWPGQTPWREGAS